MVAKCGDAFYPVASYFAGPIAGGNIGLEIAWAESEADFNVGKLETVRLLPDPDEAEDFAAELRRQAEAVEAAQATELGRANTLWHYQDRHASVRQDLRCLTPQQ
jgi:hypothetical protein